MPAEYAPLAIRQRAAALASASNWIFTFLVVEVTPVSIKNIGWRTYVYFCSMHIPHTRPSEKKKLDILTCI